MKSQQQGFTLIEILITMVIVAIVTSFAVPGMTRLINAQTAISQVSKINSAIAYARSEAVTRTSNIAICSSDDGATCANSTTWSTGWIIYVDTDPLAGVQAGDEILKIQDDLSQSARLGADVNAAIFDPLGQPDTAINFALCDRDATADFARRVTITRSGASRTSKGGVTCPS